MDDIKWLFDATMKLFLIPIHVYGYTFSFFAILMFSAILGLFIYFIRGVTE